MATIEHVVCDQGNGGAYCSNCDCDLGSEPMKIPDYCPRCKEKFTDDNIWISPGGSDF